MLYRAWNFDRREWLVLSLSYEGGLTLADELLNEVEVFHVSNKAIVVSVKHFENLFGLCVLYINFQERVGIVQKSEELIDIELSLCTFVDQASFVGPL